MSAAAVSIDRLLEPTTPVMEAVAELEDEVFGRGGLNEWHLPVITRHGHLYLARQGENLLGAASFICSLEPGRVVLVDMAVSEAYRRTGVGRRLLTMSMDGLRQDGMKVLELTVSPDNVPARALYKALGLSEAGFFSNEYGPGEDRIVMRVDLDV